jgi:hypothetical protein
MKNKKFIILIEDDFEIKGNGLGNVAELQYLPSIALMKIAKKYNIKVTFMVDMAHMLTLKKFVHFSEIRVQFNLLKDTLLLIKEQGHDVQLHLHPQWIDAKYINKSFILSSKWNIGKYNSNEKIDLIDRSVKLLTSIYKDKFPEYKVCAFKAGSWGMQPSIDLFNALDKAGFNIVLGVRNGLEIESQGVNYNNLEESHFPYSPNYSDITKISNKVNNITILPLQEYSPNLLVFTRYLLNQALNKLFKKDDALFFSLEDAPQSVKELNPLKGKNIFNFSLKPYKTHLKIGNQSFSYLKKSFDVVIERFKNCENKRIPIVIESHTKQYKGYYRDIDKFIEYILKKYGDDVEFLTLSAYNEELQSKKNCK